MNTNNSGSALASIIIPCWNQLEFTRHCISGLARHTRPPWELILVDNGSTDGTGPYCAGVQDAATFPVTVIANATNLGFPAAINQGLQHAHGDYLVLLNNDVVVTNGWLDQLIALTNAGTPAPAKLTLIDFETGGEQVVDAEPAPTIENRIGLVGPMSNYATPPQLVDSVPYRDLESMQAFAGRWRDEHLGKWFTALKLSGFCLLMKRAVYEKIGGLDERFGIGFFDDDDLAERAHRAGFELAVAQDLFVHHFGSRTFIGNGIDSESLLNENRRRFAAKWGLPESRGNRVVLRPFTVQPSGDQRPNNHDEDAQDQADETPASIRVTGPGGPDAQGVRVAQRQEDDARRSLLG